MDQGEQGARREGVRRPARWKLFAVLLAGVLAATVVALLLNSVTQPEKQWQEGETRGRWRAVFNGHGEIRGGNSEVVLAPAAADRPSETFAGLVVSAASYGDFRLRVRVRTDQQLREPRPNPWEVGWVLWHYTDPKQFYYMILKPSGWELGKEDPAYPGAQRFLAGGRANFPVGHWYEVEVQQMGASITVWANGKRLVDFTDRERPYRHGQLGLYSEDSEARFQDFRMEPVSSPAPEQSRAAGEGTTAPKGRTVAGGPERTDLQRPGARVG